MNTPSPLVPQGAVPPRAKTSVYFKILMVLGIHVVVIGGLLLQGCGKEKDPVKDTAGTSSSTTGSDQAANPLPAPPPVDTSTPAVAQVPPVTTPVSPVIPPVATQNPTPIPSPVVTTPVQTPVMPVTPPSTIPAATAGGQYVVASGDTLAAIAKKNGVSLKSLQEANAGVNPRKLHVGQKLQIPAGSSTAAATTPTLAAGGSTTEAATSSDTTTYTVKPGDRLLKIAKAHGTRVKTIMELNDLKTTAIRVGQKLKMPSRMASAEPPATTPAVQTASVPSPSTGAPAVSTTAN
jgi:LysM repeat protein